MAHGIQLNWQTDNQADSYNVYRGLNNVNFALLTSVNAGTTSYLDTTGTQGTLYYYYTTSVLGGIESGGSNVTSANFPTIPNPPTNLTATGV